MTMIAVAHLNDLLWWCLMLRVIVVGCTDNSAARVERHCRQLQKDLKSPPNRKQLERGREGYWWMAHWDPNWSCPMEEKIGPSGQGRSSDGEKWVCDTDKIMPSDCIVYSFGSNGNYVFEVGITERFYCEIHTFDPIMLGNVPPELSSFVHPHPWGLDVVSHNLSRTKRDGTPASQPMVEMKTLPHIVDELRHHNKVIDILKIDVEGFEVGVLEDLSMWEGLKVKGTIFSQILVEVHLSGVNRSSLKWKNSVKFTGATLDRLFRRLAIQGYGIFHKEVNVLPAAQLQCAEFGLVKIDVNCETLKSRGSKFVF